VKPDSAGSDPAEVGKVVLGSLLYTAGSAILYVLPAYLGELSARLGLNEAQLGSITGAENIGIALASVVSMLWLTRYNPRVLAVGATACCVVLNLVAFFSRRFDLLVAARFLTGLLGEGILFSLAFAVLGATRDPQRAFGIGLTVVVLFGSLVLGASPALDRVPFGTAALLPLAILPVGVLFALRWLPRRAGAAELPRGAAPARPAGRLALVAIAGMTIWFAAPGAFWAFAESAAAAREVPSDAISIALAVGNAAGLLGSVMAAWQGDRWGRFWPVTIATACLCVSVAAYGQCTSGIALAAALSAFNIFWNYTTVYEMALVVALDPIGKASLGISAAQVTGFAAGGFFSGLAISGGSYAALPAVVAVFALAGWLVLVPCFRQLKPQRPPG
jgi:predicted MFS family arabinose efflux permease